MPHGDTELLVDDRVSVITDRDAVPTIHHLLTGEQ